MSIVLDGTTGITAPAATIAGALSGSPVQGGLVSGTAVASTSGTSIDFTGIPSWVKRITVMFSGVSTSGTSNYLIQLGDSGGVEATGYLSSSSALTNVVATGNFTTGFGIRTANAAATIDGGLSAFNVSGNSWVISGTVADTANGATFPLGGRKTLSDVLTQVRITTVNGTDTFDAGTINIMYEG